jgi:nitroimidazol reductase NimA-like FMN-containing flavoprotein (pyridoxamine 5'-phosphate oxidase superfamily)
LTARPTGAKVPAMGHGGTFEDIGAGECMALLRGQVVGRVAVVRHVLPEPFPAILPVNYSLDGDTVVFRTASSTVLIDAALARATVAFEVDDLDSDARSGWSVLVVGPMERVSDETQLRRARSLPLEPWAPGVRDDYVRITPRDISGRRIGPAGS